jgi:hypothetical protein
MPELRFECCNDETAVVCVFEPIKAPTCFTVVEGNLSLGLATAMKSEILTTARYAQGQHETTLVRPSSHSEDGLVLVEEDGSVRSIYRDASIHSFKKLKVRGKRAGKLCCFTPTDPWPICTSLHPCQAECPV